MSGSGTGTPATIPSAVTAQDLIDDAIRPALDDAGETEFTDAELLAFLNEGIREYTQHLPRVSVTTLTAVALTRSYALGTDTRAVLSVEYMSLVLPRIRATASQFTYATAYDYLPTNDLTAAPTLLLSFDPTAAEAITVTRQHEHDHALALADNLTVPADHHHILTSYCLFAASRQQQAREEANPTSASSLLMSQYASNTRRYELSYLNQLNRILFHRRGRSQMQHWQMDDHDRIY